MKRFVCGSILGVAMSISTAAAQSDYPNRTVTIVAPATPGGFYSILAKMIGDRFQQRLNAPFITEHKPGAGTALGAAQAARSSPDGYTLLVAATPTLAVQPAILKRPLYDSNKDFSPIGMLALSPLVLAVNTSAGINSVADIIRVSKAQPGKLTFASNGAGSVLHLAGEIFKRQIGADLTHVPYKGGVPAITDVAGGHVTMMFTPLELARPLIDAGKLKAIGVSTRKRIEAIPHVPPLHEVGAPGFDVDAWFMLLAPAGTPPAIIDKLHQEVRAWADQPKVREDLIRGGSIPVVSDSPAALRQYVAQEVVRWKEVVEKAGLAGSE